MHNGITTVERAFQLARSGKYTTLRRLKIALNREGYYGNDIQGPLLSRQLMRTMIMAKNAGVGHPARTVDKSLHQKFTR